MENGKIINCAGLTQQQRSELIAKYENVGWTFCEISTGFPSNDYIWVHLEWEGNQPPIYPELKSSN
jgi:hypothetical protein